MKKPGLSAGLSILTLPVVTVSAARTAIPAGLVNCFIYTKLTAFKFMTVGACYGSGRFFIRAHFDEPESLGITGFTIENDLGRGNSTISGEHATEAIFCGVVGKITDIQFLSH